MNLPFPLIPREVLRGNVDAGVWHRVSTLITPEDAGLVTEPLPRDKLDVLARDLLDASIVWRAEDLALTRLVEGLDLDRMRDTQLAHMRKTYDDDEVFAASFMA